MRRSVAGVVLGVAMGCAAHMQAADSGVLFPEPLHFVREVTAEAPGDRTTIDEYCSDNRIVRVSGSRVTITDYARREVRELDRDTGTFSIASFEDLARALAGVARAVPAPVADETIETTQLGPGRVRVRAARLSIELRLDDAITLSRDAFDALHGAAYPHDPRPAHRLIAHASRVERGRRLEPVADAAAPDRYRLPIEQIVELESAGERVRIVTKVASVVREPIPASLLLLPAGARQVEAHSIRLARELETLDRVVVPLQ